MRDLGRPASIAIPFGFIEAHESRPEGRLSRPRFGSLVEDGSYRRVAVECHCALCGCEQRCVRVRLATHSGRAVARRPAAKRGTAEGEVFLQNHRCARLVGSCADLTAGTVIARTAMNQVGYSIAGWCHDITGRGVFPRYEHSYGRELWMGYFLIAGVCN